MREFFKFELLQQGVTKVIRVVHDKHSFKDLCTLFLSHQVLQTC